jgi:hypothetical protein
MQMEDVRGICRSLQYCRSLDEVFRCIRHAAKDRPDRLLQLMKQLYSKLQGLWDYMHSLQQYAERAQKLPAAGRYCSNSTEDLRVCAHMQLISYMTYEYDRLLEPIKNWRQSFSTRLTTMRSWRHRRARLACGPPPPNYKQQGQFKKGGG